MSSYYNAKKILLDSAENLVECFVFYNVMLQRQAEDTTLELLIAQKRDIPWDHS